MQSPVVKKRVAISPIWFLPVLAFFIGGWLLYTSYQDAGIDISIHFTTAEGITAGKTKVMYKGIPVGTVTHVGVDPELNGVVVDVEMDKKTRNALVEDTVFWLVKPEISAGRITGLDTLVSGSYIGVRKGNSTIAQREYIGLLQPPATASDVPGLHLSLVADKLYSLQRGAHIYNRNLKIGMVENYQLAESGKIMVDIFIKPEFSHLIRKDTRFWNASGLTVSGDLQSGMSVQMESVASLIYGGIACATPPSITDSPPAENGQTFHLYEGSEAARFGIPMTLQLASGEGISPGHTKVMYRGLKAGVVRSVDINDDPLHTVTATILIDPRAEQILRQTTRFYVMRPEASLSAGLKNINTLVSGAYITLLIGDGPYQDHFVIETETMPKTHLRSGIEIKLQVDEVSKVSAGAPVLFDKMKVGEVLSFQLTGKTARKQQVECVVLIYDEYAGLLNETSRFYNSSGISIDASLQGLSVQMESLEAIIAGGIAFYTPYKGKPVQEGQVFPLYNSREDALKANYLYLTLSFSSGRSISDKTKIKYQGVEIGNLTSLRYDADRDRVIARARVERKMATMFRKSTRMWLVKAEIALSGVENIDTLLGGAYITLDQGKGDRSTKFRVMDSPPSVTGPFPGLNLVLETPHLASLKPGRPVYYRQIKVGRVTGVELGPTAQNVWVHINVEKRYSPIVHRGSRFWNAGGVDVIAGLFSGVSVKTESLEALMAGGVAISTPEGKAMGSVAHNGDHFILAERPQKEWLEWSPQIRLSKTVQADGSGEKKKK